MNAFGSAARLNLLWEGTIGGHSSIAKANREICRRLARVDRLDLTILPHETGPHTRSEGEVPMLEEWDVRNKPLDLRRLLQRPSVCVRQRWPIQRRPPPRRLKWVIYQPWEYSVLPLELKAILERAAAVWAPSRFCREAFIRSGLEPDRVSTVPLGVDSDAFHPEGERLALPSSKAFRFLFVGGTIFRKGLDILLQAYSEAFRPSDDVCLVVKDFGVGAVYRGQTAGPRMRAFRDDPSNPELIYLDSELGERALATLYRSCDVFVSSYRGEGFLLPALEAMACGLPVVVTAGGATDDFCDDAVGWRIESVWKSVGHRIYDFPTEQEAFLLEPSVHHLAELLRDCFERRDEVTMKGRAARLRARQWSWDRSVDRIVERLTNLTGVELR